MALLLSITSASAADRVLADHGRSDYTIVITPDAADWIKHMQALAGEQTGDAK